ncbi:hypothetical protein COLO4_29757 [Corchorus olitorius]|uniref:Uncharacterized protein n=1 Tax=Corchorus olitorius TaxID=93759 RepID=A0A1R3HD99_9ROSI|nr:hypothetical protein COLO4_29757 [Corchorus olitorius]
MEEPPISFSRLSGSRRGRAKAIRRKYREALAAAKAKRRKKEHCKLNGGPSEASEQPEPKREEKKMEEFIKTSVGMQGEKHGEVRSENEFAEEISVRSVEELLKKETASDVLDCFERKVDRMIEKDKMSINLLLSDYWGYDFKQIPTEVTDEMKHRSEKEEIKMCIQQLKGIGVGTSLFRCAEIAQNGPSADQGRGSWQTPKSDDEHSYIVDEYAELEKMLLANSKKHVKFSDFPGLEEELLETAGGEIPKYLQDIASKIKKACATKETENVLILLYAAIHEMEQCKRLEDLNWYRLSTWVATYNQAKDAGFQLKFVEQHLKKILYAYICFYLKKWCDPKETVQELGAELEMLMRCLSAEQSFRGKPLSYGMFPQ